MQDWILLGYHALLVVAALTAADSPDRTRSITDMTGLLVLFASTMLLVRGRLLQSERARALLYRIVFVSTMELSYFFMRRFLPLVNPRALDHELLHFDLAVFGVEPAIYFEQFLTPNATEWFAFFYYGYFFLLFAHVVPIVFFSRRRQLLNEFTLGALCVFAVGHLLYILVPGYGPGVAMPEQFQGPLAGGPWLDAVRETVAAGGAQKDIFPSIHTAVPVYITLWSFRHRFSLPYRYTWPIVAFFTLNIVLATMVLRWHYLVDVVAGILLACLGLWITIPVTRYELERRAEKRLRPVWPEYDGSIDPPPLAPDASRPELARSSAE